MSRGASTGRSREKLVAFLPVLNECWFFSNLRGPLEDSLPENSLVLVERPFANDGRSGLC
jgi:hypothetical protein